MQTRITTSSRFIGRCVRKAAGAARYSLSTVFALALLSSLAASASAQVFDLSWNSTDGGGATVPSTNAAGWQLVGTIGQPDANTSPMSGNGYELVGGFWNVQVAFPCVGDLNHDRVVSLRDLTILLANFGTIGGVDASHGDLNGDDRVGLGDLTLFLSNFGTICPS